MGLAFKRLPSWQRLWRYSVATAFVSLGFLVALIVSIEAYSVTGMWQRLLLLLTLFLWFGVVGLHAFKQPSVDAGVESNH